MKSLLRKIKGYGDEPDLTSDYVVKTWETFTSYYQYPNYNYTIYKVTPNGLKEMKTDYCFDRKVAESQIKNLLRNYRNLDKPAVRWYP